ncbi:MAG: CoA transferase [Dehalococcoidia bacterium]
MAGLRTAPGTPVEFGHMEGLPLEGVRVLEVGGGIAAAYATRWLAGYGADVVRTEGPPDVLTDDETIYLVSGKRRIAADVPQLRALALAADIVVDDGPPGSLAERGLDPEGLRREKPPLVVVSITPFGQAGPYAEYRATNIVAHAAGGIMSLTGLPERPPLQNAGSQAFYLGGLNGFAAAVTAYYGALVQGEGDRVDISMQECAAGMLELFGPRSAYTGEGPVVRSGNHVSAVWGIYQVKDGWGGVCALGRQIPGLFAAIGDPDLQDERFLDPVKRLENNDELAARMFAWFAERTKQELLELGVRYRVPFGAVLTPLELLENPSLNERGYFDAVETPAGTARVPGRPFLGFGWRAGTLHEPAADTHEVVRDWLERGT